MYGSCDCSIVVLRLGNFQGTCVGHVLFRSIREKETDASPVTPGAQEVESSEKAVRESATNWLNKNPD